LLAGCATSAPAAAEPVVLAQAPVPAAVQANVERVPVTPVPVPPVVIVQSPAPDTPVIVPQVNEEEQQALALLADLQRYAAETGEDLKRELAVVSQTVTRTRSDASRIRMAVLLTMPAAGPTDDARALALLDSVTGKGGATSPLKQIAAILYTQIAERTRLVREEQRKTAAAQEKLDALRAIERSLLLERSRNAGGGGGGGGGGGTGR
jgi:isochorismate hydrolase